MPSMPGAVRRVPSSRYDQPWYGHTTARCVAVPPTGSSSWPRWRQTLANARTPPSVAVSSTPTSPTSTARYVLMDSSSARPRQDQPPANTCRRSHRSTSWSRYAAAGSITDSPCARNAAWRSTGSMGAAVMPAIVCDRPRFCQVCNGSAGKRVAQDDAGTGAAGLDVDAGAQVPGQPQPPAADVPGLGPVVPVEPPGGDA